MVNNSGQRLFLTGSVSSDYCSILLNKFSDLRDCNSLDLYGIGGTVSRDSTLVFPLPSVEASKDLGAPFSGRGVLLSNSSVRVVLGGPIFAAVGDEFLGTCPELSSNRVFSCKTESSFTVLGTLPATRNTVRYTVERCRNAVSNDGYLITKFNEVKGVLTRGLILLKTGIAIDTEGPSSLTCMGTLNCGTLGARGLEAMGQFSVIFGAVPGLVFSERLLVGASAGALVVSLTSLPKKISFSATRGLKVCTIETLSLPKGYTPGATKRVVGAAMFSVVGRICE